jgi:hypothetical protein
MELVNERETGNQAQDGTTSCVALSFAESEFEHLDVKNEVEIHAEGSIREFDLVYFH